MNRRIGIDIGGTFTDVITIDDVSGDIIVNKVATTPDAPEQGCINAINQLPSSVLPQSDYFVHATTFGLNTLLERSSTQVGLLLTKGFRDVLEIRKGLRDDNWYDLKWSAPDALVPRHLRVEVGGRINAQGEQFTPLSMQDIEQAYRHFQKDNIDVIAICYVNAYLNSEHEKQTELYLRQLGFRGKISMSHAISNEYRDYERMSTTVADAIVKNRLSDYLQTLKHTLKDQGFMGHCLMSRSGGGSMLFEQVDTRAFEVINSGPAAGVQGAAVVGKRLNIEHIITVDIGGTSFDASLVKSQEPDVVYNGTVASIPLQTPWVNVHSIAIGGGSHLSVDEVGRLQVGPSSAGASPGPACYGRGGQLPTLTDAACYLGMLGAGQLTEDTFADVQLAENALLTLQDRLQLSVLQIASGSIRLACAAMNSTLKALTIERGVDPRNASMFAYGGAGPLFASVLCNEFVVREVVIPPYAGNFSAWGLLCSDLLRTSSANVFAQVTAVGLRKIEEKANALFTQMRLDQNEGNYNWIEEVKLDVRYRGQEHCIGIDVPYEGGKLGSSPAEIKQTFNKIYAEKYIRALDKAIEVVCVRVSLRAALQAPELSVNHSGMVAPSRNHQGFWQTYSFSRESMIQFTVLGRHEIQVNQVVSGPVIITEKTTTIYVDADFEVMADPLGCLRISKKK